MILTYVFHRRPRRPSVRELLGEIVESFAILIQETRKMSQATTNLQTAVAGLQTTATAIEAKLNAPPVIVQGEDPIAVQAEADKVAAVDAGLKAALNPPAPAV